MTTKKTTTKKAVTKAAKKTPAKKREPHAAATKVETTAGTKPAKTKKPAKEQVPGKLSALDAAAKVLAEAGEPMTSKAMIDAMAAKGYWTSPGGRPRKPRCTPPSCGRFKLRGPRPASRKRNAGTSPWRRGPTPPPKPRTRRSPGRRPTKPRSRTGHPVPRRSPNSLRSEVPP